MQLWQSASAHVSYAAVFTGVAGGREDAVWSEDRLIVSITVASPACFRAASAYCKSAICIREFEGEIPEGFGFIAFHMTDSGLSVRFGQSELGHCVLMYRHVMQPLLDLLPAFLERFSITLAISVSGRQKQQLDIDIEFSLLDF